MRRPGHLAGWAFGGSCFHGPITTHPVVIQAAQKATVIRQNIGPKITAVITQALDLFKPALAQAPPVPPKK